MAAANHSWNANPASSSETDAQDLPLVPLHGPRETSYGGWIETGPLIRYNWPQPVMMAGAPPDEKALKERKKAELERKQLLAAGALYGDYGLTVDQEEARVYLLEKKQEKEEQKKRSARASATEPKWIYFWSPRHADHVCRQVLLDTGGRTEGANFITRELVAELGLTPEKTMPRPFNQLIGSVMLDETVELSWSPSLGDNENRTIRCWVLPGDANPTTPLFGASFIRPLEESGVELLSEKPHDYVAYAAQRQYTEQERRQIAVMRSGLSAKDAVQASERERTQTRANEGKSRREKLDKTKKRGSGSSWSSMLSPRKKEVGS